MSEDGDLTIKYCGERKELDLTPGQILQAEAMPHGHLLIDSDQLSALLERDDCQEVCVSVLNLGSFRLEKQQVIHNISAKVQTMEWMGESARLYEAITGIKVFVRDGCVMIQNPEWTGK